MKRAHLISREIRYHLVRENIRCVTSIFVRVS